MDMGQERRWWRRVLGVRGVLSGRNSACADEKERMVIVRDVGVLVMGGGAA